MLSAGLLKSGSYPATTITIRIWCRLPNLGQERAQDEGPLIASRGEHTTQWMCHLCRHPYQKYGYGLVFIVGLGTYAAYTISKARLVPLAIMLVSRPALAIAVALQPRACPASTGNIPATSGECCGQ